MTKELNQISEDIQTNLIALLEDEVDPRLLCATLNIVIQTLGKYGKEGNQLPCPPKLVHINI